MVSQLRTWILKRFIYLLWARFVTLSEFNCLGNVAKPYSVSDPTYLLQIPNTLHYTHNSAHQVLITIYRARLLSFFTVQSFALFMKQ